MLLLLACATGGDPAPDTDAPHDSPTDTGPSDTDGDDSGDSGDTAAADTAPACPPFEDTDTAEPIEDWVCERYGLGTGELPALTAPRAIGTGEEVPAARWDVTDRSVYLATGLLRDDADYGCPATEVLADGRTRYVGGCTTAGGRTYRGIAEHAYAGSTTCWRFSRFRLETSGGDLRWAADGAWSSYSYGDQLESSWELTTDTCDPTGAIGGVSGRHTVYGRYFYNNATTLLTAYVSIEGGESPDGDFVYEEDLNPWACYDEELDGYQRVTGASFVELIWDGGTVCDGCGTVTVDGAAAGEVCEE